MNANARKSRMHYEYHTRREHTRTHSVEHARNTS